MVLLRRPQLLAEAPPARRVVGQREPAPVDSAEGRVRYRVEVVEDSAESILTEHPHQRGH